MRDKIMIRRPESIYGAHGKIQDGTFQGRWHFSFDQYIDPGLEPSVEQMAVEREDQTNRFLPLVSNDHSGSLRIFSDAEVYSSFLRTGQTVKHELKAGRGGYLYVLEGGPVQVNDHLVSVLGAAEITGSSGRMDL